MYNMEINKCISEISLNFKKIKNKNKSNKLILPHLN